MPVLIESTDLQLRSEMVSAIILLLSRDFSADNALISSIYLRVKMVHF